MTEDEITKAAYYFAKAGGKIDLQHSFEPLDGATVVESWIAKADFDIEGEPVKKGTWLMTVELADGSLWDAIEKGEITGFSMGGVGNYSKEDVDLEDVEKADSGGQQEPSEKKGLIKKLAEMFGYTLVEKGELADQYAAKTRLNSFWTAFYTLEDLLCHYDGWSGREQLETDETKVREALEDFTKIVTELLTSSEPVTKAIATEEPIRKVGKKMSGKNRDTLQGIYETLGTFLAAFDDPDKEEPEDGEEPADGDAKAGDKTDDKDKDKEEKDVNKAEVQKMVEEAVAVSVKKALGEGAQPTGGTEEITAEAVQKMVDEAVKKALTPAEQDEPVTAEGIAKMVEEAVSKAVEPVLKARGVPSAINDSGTGGDPIEKQQHYLHGIL